MIQFLLLKGRSVGSPFTCMAKTQKTKQLYTKHKLLLDPPSEVSELIKGGKSDICSLSHHPIDIFR